MGTQFDEEGERDVHGKGNSMWGEGTVRESSSEERRLRRELKGEFRFAGSG